MKYNAVGKILNFIGIVLMVAVIAATFPLNVPKWFGLQIYEVLTGSMEPTYPIGSVVYVKTADVGEVQEGDAITYTLGENSEYVMTHRVTRIDAMEQVFVTKGDANEAEDVDPVHFSRLIGKPVYCIPYLGFVSDYFHTTTGKSVCVCIFITALLMWMFAEFRSRKVLRWMAVGMIGFSLAGLVVILIEYRQGEKEYDQLQEFVKTSDVVVEEIRRTDATEEVEAVFVPQMQIAQKLSELMEQNKDIIGWIAFDKLKINYPIMQAKDNYYYLTHTFSGEENKVGSIFMDAGNKAAFTDYHSIIYGHNMKNGSMFGLLKKYYDEEFYRGNEFFTIYTDMQAYRYEIFSAHTVSETDEIYTIWYTPGELAAEYEKFVEHMKKDSWYETGVEISAKDKIITLSTCTASDETRFVVQGKLVAVYEFQMQNIEKKINISRKE